jgi:hypothetical protein
LVINSVSGLIDISSSTPGVYTITYTTGGSIPNSENFILTINASPTASVTDNNGLALSCTILTTTLTASGGTSYSWSD